MNFDVNSQKSFTYGFSPAIAPTDKELGTFACALSFILFGTLCFRAEPKTQPDAHPKPTLFPHGLRFNTANAFTRT